MEENPLLEPIEQYVIDTVRRMRMNKKISQKDLAYSLDLSIGFIGDVESYKSRAKYNLSHINRLAEVFDCSPKDFLPEQYLENKTEQK
ncbi:helix-turn-helix domain-containing protein [Chryseobacterium rhizosphaerae]|uniref:helix-turn-helix domain-containing protein n=1 Tax=Chryseobacterium rhizosphaerae TaxID=395937 RepID=UPI00235852D0|nr:helix-turn-helix transcriptional regulator [Chryseobacterium rhizosphaerae]MDC8099157.1 helix-turn-helix transcriptional regulator [Chryseobacterium rhizosphaerae]